MSQPKSSARNFLGIGPPPFPDTYELEKQDALPVVPRPPDLTHKLLPFQERACEGIKESQFPKKSQYPAR